MIGSIGAVIIEKNLDKRREDLQARKALVQKYIFQLQDAIEDLYFRLDNLWNREGRNVMKNQQCFDGDEYFEITTLYALGKVLAVERIMSLEGVYPQLDLLSESSEYEDFGNYLRSCRKTLQLRELFEELDVYRYVQRALAESVIVSDTNGFRPSTFLEFDRLYSEANEEQDQKWLNSARVQVHKLYNPHTFPDSKNRSLLYTLEQVSSRLADKTMVASTIGNKSSHLAEE